MTTVRNRTLDHWSCHPTRRLELTCADDDSKAATADAITEIIVSQIQ